jgi:hypothetical protein
MGTCLTGIIACQTRIENPAQTLSDFDPDSYVVHPASRCDLVLFAGCSIIMHLA